MFILMKDINTWIYKRWKR